MPKYGKRRGDRNGINVGGSVCAGIQGAGGTDV